MEEISSIRDLINLWPTRAQLADDIRIRAPSLRVNAAQVHKWADAGSIPSKYHYPILESARDRGFGVSADLIVELHAPKASAA